jgi:ABC-type multidrug transport system fused ATPase/permease subunit
MAETIIGIVAAVALLILLGVLLATRAQVRQIHSELRSAREALHTEIAQTKGEALRELARARSETRQEREEREAAEAQRREQATHRQLERVAAADASAVEEFVRIGGTHSVVIQRPTQALASLDGAPAWWSRWIEENQASFAQLWASLNNANAAEIGSLASAIQRMLAAYPESLGGSDQAKPLAAMLDGLARNGPEALLGLVVSHPKLVGAEALAVAQERLGRTEESQEPETPYSSYESDPSGYCCPCNSTPG